MSGTPKPRRRYALPLALGAALYLFVLHAGLEQRQASDRRAADGNRAIAVARRLSAYAHNHEGEWPPVNSGHPFAYNPVNLPPGYELAHPRDNEEEKATPIDALLLGRISRHNALSLTSFEAQASEYRYLGYATTNEAEGLALIEALSGRGPLGEAIPVPEGKGTLGSQTLYRLHNDLLETLVADHIVTEEDPLIRRRIPVLIQRPTDGHAWVVYFDLHAEYLPYPGAYPLTEAFVNAIE